MKCNKKLCGVSMTSSLMFRLAGVVVIHGALFFSSDQQLHGNEFNVWTNSPDIIDELTEKTIAADLFLVEIKDGITAQQFDSKSLVVSTYRDEEQILFTLTLLLSKRQSRPILDEKIKVIYRADGGELTEQTWAYIAPNRYDTIVTEEKLLELFAGNFVIFQTEAGGRTERMRYDISQTKELPEFRKALKFFIEKGGVVNDWGELSRSAEYWSK